MADCNETESCSDVNMGGDHVVCYEQLVSSNASIDKHLEVDLYAKIKLPHIPCKPPVTESSSYSEYLMPTDEATRATTTLHASQVSSEYAQPVAIFNTDTNNICDCLNMNVDACKSSVNVSGSSDYYEIVDSYNIVPLFASGDANDYLKPVNSNIDDINSDANSNYFLDPMESILVVAVNSNSGGDEYDYVEPVVQEYAGNNATFLLPEQNLYDNGNLELTDYDNNVGHIVVSHFMKSVYIVSNADQFNKFYCNPVPYW